MGWFDAIKLAKRVGELEDVVTKLERAWQERDLDWIELRARCRRLLDRTEKAAARIAAHDTEVESEALGSSNGEGAVGATTPGRLLTPHQMQVQQMILKRRGGGA